MNLKLYNVKVVLRLGTGLLNESRSSPARARAIMRAINAHIQSGRVNHEDADS